MCNQDNGSQRNEVMETIDVNEQTASPAPDSQLVKVMGNVQEGMYSLCSLQNVEFCNLVDEHWLIHAVCLWNLWIWRSGQRHVMF